MLIGMPRPKPVAATPASGPGQDPVGDVKTADFQAAVVERSFDVPVLADFWAPWCGPCKQLTPLLEQAVRAAAGAVVLAKINIDENPDLAQALRIQSVPTVYAFFQGRPVDAFAGARPASEIKTLIDKLVALARSARPDALDIPATLRAAAQALAGGDPAEAQALYADILTQDAGQVEAWAGMVRAFIAAGQTEAAQEFADSSPEAVQADSRFAAARTALDLARESVRLGAGELGSLQSRLAANPADHAARFDLAMALFAADSRDQAVEALVEIIRRERDWQDDKARKQLLQFFDAWGPADPATVIGRRKLSSALFA